MSNYYANAPREKRLNSLQAKCSIGFHGSLVSSTSLLFKKYFDLLQSTIVLNSNTTVLRSTRTHFFTRPHYLHLLFCIKLIRLHG